MVHEGQTTSSRRATTRQAELYMQCVPSVLPLGIKRLMAAHTERNNGVIGGVRAATNMLAVSFARNDTAAASGVLSDALGIAFILGTVLAVALYVAAPAALSAIAGSASREVIAPALSYVRIRCALHCKPSAILVLFGHTWCLFHLLRHRHAFRSLTHLC
jgi:hypothetical protein